MFSQPPPTPGAVVSWDLNEVPDVELNQAIAAGQHPQAFIAARNAAVQELSEPTLGPQAGGWPAVSGRRTSPAPSGAPARETEAEDDEDLGLFGPDKPELDDIRAGEDMSASAWAENSGEWPPSDAWARRGLHNLLTRMTEELDAAGPLAPDATVTVRVGDLDNVLMMAVSALYEADTRSGEMEAIRSTEAELEAGEYHHLAGHVRTAVR